MGERNFQLPGLGSYIQTATYEGDTHALICGIATVVLIVVATDQLIWRPLIAWSDKFKLEQVESTDRVISPILALLQRSPLLTKLPGEIWARFEEPIYRRFARTRESQIIRPLDEESRRGGNSVLFWGVCVALAATTSWAIVEAVLMMRTVTGADLRLLFEGAAATFLRVNTALLISVLWTVPVGVAIGFNPRLARIVEPLAQVLASVPASAFYPVLLIG